MMCPQLFALAVLLVPVERPRPSDPPASTPRPADPAPKVRTPKVLWQVPLKSQSFGGGAVADVDGDGRLEVAFATYFGDSSVYCLHGKDGKPLWKHEGTNQCLDASLKFTDIDDDGRLEMIVPVSNSSEVLCLNAKSGKQIWKYEAGPGECIDTPPSIVDLEGDGEREVLVGTFKGKLHVMRLKDGKALRTIPCAPGAVQSAPAIVDIDGDKVKDLVVCNFKGDNRVHAVSGKDGKELWTAQTGDNIYHGPSVGDLDGDGTPELTVACYDGRVYALRAKDGKILWKKKPGDRYFMSPTVHTDVDGDGRQEVIACGQKLTVFCGDGSTLYSVKADEAMGWGVTRGVAVADLDGDGGPDLAYLTGNGMFRVVRGRDGATLYEFDAGTLSKKPLMQGSHGPMIADLDGDGRLDVFFVVGGGLEKDKFGIAVCLTGFAGRGEGWYMFRHDHWNTGNVKTEIEEAVRNCIPGEKGRKDGKRIAL